MKDGMKQIGWVCRSPRGKAVLLTMHKTRGNAMLQLVYPGGLKVWKRLYRKGWRIVKCYVKGRP